MQLILKDTELLISFHQKLKLNIKFQLSIKLIDLLLLLILKMNTLSTMDLLIQITTFGQKPLKKDHCKELTV